MRLGELNLLTRRHNAGKIKELKSEILQPTLHTCLYLLSICYQREGMQTHRPSKIQTVSMKSCNEMQTGVEQAVTQAH